MRGQTAAEQRVEQLQAATSIGLLADNLALASMRYPAIDDERRLALTEILRLIDALSSSETGPSQAFPSRKAMSDPHLLVVRAAAAVHPTAADQRASGIPELTWLRAPVEALLGAVADEAARETVGAFAEILARATLQIAEELVNEKGTDEWSPRVSTFSAV